MAYKLGDIFNGDYPITQPFGANAAYYGQFGLSGHEGVDWGTPTGTVCTAPFAGIVLRAGFNSDYSNYGNIVVVWDPVQKCAVWYAHMSTWSVYAGNKVIKGQVLGRTGATGNVTGSHLHFGVVETDANGNRLNINNGYIGFINPLGSKITWELGTPPVTVDYKAKCDTLKIATDRLNKELISDLANPSVNYKSVYESTTAKAKTIGDTGKL